MSDHPEKCFKISSGPAEIVLSQLGDERKLFTREGHSISISLQSYDGDEWITDPGYGCTLGRAEVEALARAIAGDTIAELHRMRGVIISA